MSTESRWGGSGLLSSGWLAAVLLAAGAFVLREPLLQSTRPAANEPRIEQRFAAQDVDARLWQDPLGAVMRAREERVRKLGRAEQQALERQQQGLAAFQQEIAARLPAGDPAGRIIVLAAMVSGGPYAESVESRRRMRYAVLAALNAADYAPADTEHLGYFLPQSQPPRTLPEAVPYEWFKPLPGRQPVAHPVLVLWLDNGPFYDRPFDKWRELLRQLEPDSSQPSRLLWRALGPMGSDGLHAMIRDSERQDFDLDHFKGWDLRFYSLAATVSDAKLLEDTWRARNESLSDYFQRKGITLLRTIGDDKSLAASLVNELGLRGLKVRASPEPGGNGEARQERYREMCRVGTQRADSPHQIAIVAEWDTLYGRSLRREFRIAEDDDKGFCVNRFHYVRGLDGQMPEHGSAPSASGGAKDGGAAKDAERRSDGSFIERAEGQSQYDYLRRLAARLRERDRELRAGSVDGAGLRAIGVLGNDVHDKLLVLQALRADFPHALFFTTDLDARFLHPREQPWTRNLIVASNFGLRLTDGLQAGTPPFRDNYQTSAFFSTRLALDDQAGASRVGPQQLARWLGQPRIFEIGRSMAFDFSAPAQAGNDERRACRGSQLAACADIHPPGSPRYPHISPLVLSLLAGVLVLLVWLPPLALNRALQRRLRRFATHRGGPWPAWLRQAVLALLLMLLQLVLPVVLAHQWPGFADWLTRDGKPISFSEGISLWPTEAIHLLTLLLCLYLVFRGWTALTRNLDRLSLTLHLGQTRRRLVAEQAREDARLSLRCRLAHVFTLRGPSEPDSSHPAALRAGRMTAGRLALWRHFIVQNRTGSRFLRSLACTVLVLAVGLALHTGLAEPSGAPQRGPVSSSVHLLLAIAAIVLMNFLVFYVADATLICLRFVRELRPGRANWPDRAIQFFGRQMGITKPEVVDYWINLQFIAQRTRCVTGLIYYPFIVLSLLLLSRSQFFDNWQMPTMALAMALFDIGVVLLSAICLRRAAEKARRQALTAVGDWLLQAHAPDAQALPAPRQLELLRERIKTLDEGAFAPFSQQPLLKAVLLPFATLGGSSLLDFLAMANI